MCARLNKIEIKLLFLLYGKGRSEENMPKQLLNKEKRFSEVNASLSSRLADNLYEYVNLRRCHVLNQIVVRVLAVSSSARTKGFRHDSKGSDKLHILRTYWSCRVA